MLCVHCYILDSLSIITPPFCPPIIIIIQKKQNVIDIGETSKNAHVWEVEGSLTLVLFPDTVGIVLNAQV